MALAANYGNVEAATAWLFESAPRTGDHGAAGPLASQPASLLSNGLDTVDSDDDGDVEDVDDVHDSSDSSSGGGGSGGGRSNSPAALDAVRLSALTALSQLSERSGRSVAVGDSPPSIASLLDDADATPPGAVSRLAVLAMQGEGGDNAPVPSSSSSSSSVPMSSSPLSSSSSSSSSSSGGRATRYGREQASAESGTAPGSPGKRGPSAVDGRAGEDTEEKAAMKFSLDAVSFGLIDDSRGKDVPLFEAKLEKMQARLGASKYTADDFTVHLHADCCLACNAFNPELSAWEPIMEPWTPTLVVSVSVSVSV